ncbi:MAG: RIP metalloprotease RseP [Terracidiphilus sp.]|nr:RIP metalloprotease RseP [Terracidiphilus sp.]
MHDFVVSAIAFVILIAIMVVVHEFGHFAVAKLCRVRVEAFSVGFGPRLFGVKYGETDYKICLLPFGGFVKMTGENPGDDSASDDPGAFTNHPRWQRMLIGLAGPAANFVLAFVMMVFYFGWINEVPDVRTSVLEWVSAGSPAAQAGLQPGDVIQQLGSASQPDLETVVDVTRKNPGQALPVTALRNGQLVRGELRLPSNTDSSTFELSQTGMFLQYATSSIGVDQVVDGTPGQLAGLRAGDHILAIDGHVFHTLDPFINYLQAGNGKPVTLTVSRNGVTLPPVIVTPNQQDKQWRLGFVGVPPADPPMKTRPLSFGESISESRAFCAENSVLIVDVLRKLLTHQASVKQLSGPVGIARAAGQAAQTKFWAPKFGLAAGISLNLGILNLLPFPILDGGLILLLFIESLMRHDISLVIKERIYQAAFVMLIMFFVYVSFNDIAKLSVFSHLVKP